MADLSSRLQEHPRVGCFYIFNSKKVIISCMLKKIIFLVLLVTLLLVVLFLSTPNNLLVTPAPIVLAFGIVYLFSSLVLDVIRAGHTMRKYVPLLISFVVTLGLVLSSLNQLSVRDVIISGLLVLLLTFYVSKY